MNSDITTFQAPDSDMVHCEPTILTTVDGSVEIRPLSNGRFNVTLIPVDRDVFVPLVSCETSLPPEVVASFLNESFAWLCDSLSRHDDSEYVKRALSKQLLAYLTLPISGASVCWISAAARVHPPCVWRPCFQRRRWWVSS